MKKPLVMALTALFLLMTTVPECVFAAEADMSAQVAAAKTAADHEAIADEYAKQAAAAEADAAMHDKMAATYKGLSRAVAYHGDQHCKAIAARYREQAKELNALAAAHRERAKALAK